MYFYLLMDFAPRTYMQRCLDLARLGAGKVSPNPLVGAVLVCENKIIGEGYHEKFGEAHAEVNAIAQVKDKHLLSKSTLYVSLEPCSHFGKTPPCADLIIEKKIPQVIIATQDPFKQVNGSGIEKLISAGVKVETGLLNEESKELNKRFFTYNISSRPYVILKWAQSADGYLFSSQADKQISNSYSTTLVHQWRHEEDAILVGFNTALNDDPQLNVRHWQGKNPLRCVIDPNLALPSLLRIFDNSTPTIIYNYSRSEVQDQLTFVKLNPTKPLVSQILSDLFTRRVQSLMIEGGSRTLAHFIEAEMWDEARIITATDKFFGQGIIRPELKGDLVHQQTLHNDLLSILKNPSHPVL